MAGHVRGTIECLMNGGTANASSQEAYNVVYAFINLYNFFNSHSNCTMIASYYGNNVSGANGFAGTGFTYTSPSISTTTSSNAWFVTRMNATATRPYDVYHLFQWATGDGGTAPWNGGTVFGSKGGTPGLLNGGTGTGGGGAAIGHSCAIGIGGTGGSTLSVSNGYGNPWKGTTNNNGADTKGSTVWGIPSGGGTSVLIFPRSNNLPQGSFTSLTQNTVAVVVNSAAGNSSMRQQILADDDSWVTLMDTTNSGNYQMASSGIYIPKPNISASIVPYYQFSHGFNINVTTLFYVNVPQNGTQCYGTWLGSSTYEGGVGTYSYGTPSIRGIQLDQLQSFAIDSHFFPNLQNGSAYDELDIAIGCAELNNPQAGYSAGTFLNGQQNDQNGFLGRIDFIRQSYNIVANSTKTDFSRYFIGATATQAQQKYSVPWDNVHNTVPLSGTTPQGTTFVSITP